ncbi:hypothetical protein NL108_009640 [Boleophthalmus pectinirostris]|nr:hypothetical protein NL108_009640 [Boleophthalmus pectinirostris]
MFINQSEPQCSVTTYSLLTAWVCVYTLFVPLFIFVLFVGFQQFRSKTSATSNFDVFTINITIMEILNIIAAYVYFSGFYSKNLHIKSMGRYLGLVATTGQVVFHNLTCGERYLAVVHPITYLHFKKWGGVKVGKIRSGCAWVMSIVLVMVTYFTESESFEFVYITLLHSVSIHIVCFCTASVLCVLIRPRPGEVGRDKKALDQSKRKAFNTMITTLAVLLSRLISILLSYCIFFLPNWDLEIKCNVMLLACWCALPSSLMLPLLFLHRAGKLPKWK